MPTKKVNAWRLDDVKGWLESKHRFAIWCANCIYLTKFYISQNSGNNHYKLVAALIVAAFKRKHLAADIGFDTMAIEGVSYDRLTTLYLWNCRYMLVNNYCVYVLFGCDLRLYFERQDDIAVGNELRQAAFRAFASLGANDEDIRKKVAFSTASSWPPHGLLMASSWSPDGLLMVSWWSPDASCLDQGLLIWPVRQRPMKTAQSKNFLQSYPAEVCPGMGHRENDNTILTLKV